MLKILPIGLIFFAQLVLADQHAVQLVQADRLDGILQGVVSLPQEDFNQYLGQALAQLRDREEHPVSVEDYYSAIQTALQGGFGIANGRTEEHGPFTHPELQSLILTALRELKRDHSSHLVDVFQTFLATSTHPEFQAHNKAFNEWRASFTYAGSTSNPHLHASPFNESIFNAAFRFSFSLMLLKLMDDKAPGELRENVRPTVLKSATTELSRLNKVILLWQKRQPDIATHLTDSLVEKLLQTHPVGYLKEVFAARSEAREAEVLRQWYRSPSAWKIGNSLLASAFVLPLGVWAYAILTDAPPEMTENLQLLFSATFMVLGTTTGLFAHGHHLDRIVTPVRKFLNPARNEVLRKAFDSQCSSLLKSSPQAS